MVAQNPSLDGTKPTSWWHKPTARWHTATLQSAEHGERLREREEHIERATAAHTTHHYGAVQMLCKAPEKIDEGGGLSEDEEGY